MANQPAKQSPAQTGDALADHELVRRFRGGERRAFDLLVRAYQERIYYVTRRYLGNDADAQDVTQRAFVRAYKAIDSFRGDSSFKTWIYRIAINLAKNHIRDNKREQAHEIGDDELASSAVGLKRVIAVEASEQLRAAIAELPPKQRTILELRVYDELSFKEIAEVAECSENSAKVNFHHAVKRLKAIFAESAGE